MSFKFTGISFVKIGGHGRSGPPPPMLCIRPDNPAKAIAKATEISELFNAKKISITVCDLRFQALLDSQPYTCVGFVRQPLLKFTDGESQLVDRTGKEVGRTQPGDSFVLATAENVAEALKP